MATKPDQLPIWADLDQVDPVSQSNNVLTPPPAWQSYGWIRGQFPPRNWFNWLGRYTYRWIKWLNQQESQAVVTDGTGATPSYPLVFPGLAYIYVVDTGNSANVYHGMVYLPASPGSPVPFVDIKKVGITTPQVAVDGSVTISGGTGTYICYCQLKTIP